MIGLNKIRTMWEPQGFCQHNNYDSASSRTGRLHQKTCCCCTQQSSLLVQQTDPTNFKQRSSNAILKSRPSRLVWTSCPTHVRVRNPKALLEEAWISPPPSCLPHYYKGKHCSLLSWKRNDQNDAHCAEQKTLPGYHQHYQMQCWRVCCNSHVSSVKGLTRVHVLRAEFRQCKRAVSSFETQHGRAQHAVAGNLGGCAHQGLFERHHA